MKLNIFVLNYFWLSISFEFYLTFYLTCLLGIKKDPYKYIFYCEYTNFYLSSVGEATIYQKKKDVVFARAKLIGAILCMKLTYYVA